MPKSWVVSWQSQFDHLRMPGPFVNIGGLWQLEADGMKVSLRWISAKKAAIYLQPHTGLSRSLRGGFSLPSSSPPRIFHNGALCGGPNCVKQEQLPPPLRQGTEASAKPFHLNQKLSRWRYNFFFFFNQFQLKGKLNVERDMGCHFGLTLETAMW